MNRRFAVILLSALSICACIPASPNGASGNRVARAETSARQSLRLELPAITKGQTVIEHDGYTSSFNSVTMIPNWVAYELTSEELNGTVKRPSNSPFQPDPSYKGRQPQRSDYSNSSNWDKGHMAPCADMKWSEDAMFESFYLTNVCPQNRSLNAGDWESLEDKARSIARQKRSLFIVCGPIIGENRYGTLGEAKVVIPDAFFKALLYKDSDGFHSIAFVMPNEGTHHSLGYYAMTVNDVEKLTGLDLFSALNDKIEEETESQLRLSDWQIRN